MRKIVTNGNSPLDINREFIYDSINFAYDLLSDFYLRALPFLRYL